MPWLSLMVAMIGSFKPNQPFLPQDTSVMILSQQQSTIIPVAYQLFLNISGAYSTESLFLKFLHTITKWSPRNQEFSEKRRHSHSKSCFSNSPQHFQGWSTCICCIILYCPVFVSFGLVWFFLCRWCVDIPRLSRGMQCGLVGATSGKSLFK